MLVESRQEVLREPDGRLLVLETNRDITARKHVEERLRSILETVPDAIVTIDERGLVTSFSPAAEATFGFRAEELIGRNVSLLMPEPYRSAHDGYMARYLGTGERRIIGIGREVEGLRRDGTVFPMELAVGEAFASGERFFTGFVRDLTQRQRLEQELRQAQKMEAVGQLTGGVAHDFNNLLTVVMGNLEMLEDRLAGPDDLAMLREAREAAQLRRRADRPPPGLRPAPAAAAEGGRPRPGGPGGGGRCCAGPWARRSRSRPCWPPGLPPVMVDPGQLQNALLNLAINARDAMPGGGRLTIETAAVDLDEDVAATHPGLKPGRYLMLAVADTGTGMPPEVRERAFEPFFTTKGPGAGSGLGLGHGLRLRQAERRARRPLQRGRPRHGGQAVPAAGGGGGRGGEGRTVAGGGVARPGRDGAGGGGRARGAAGDGGPAAGAGLPRAGGGGRAVRRWRRWNGTPKSGCC